jgi:hypothetical protein
MEVDFIYHLLRVFHPDRITQSLRSASMNFIRETNLDTYAYLSEIYDYVQTSNPQDQVRAAGFAHELKALIDAADEKLKERGRDVLSRLRRAYATGGWQETSRPSIAHWMLARSPDCSARDVSLIGIPGFPETPIPYQVFKSWI